jgi:DNA-binding transcriptional regulator YbjK
MERNTNNTKAEINLKKKISILEVLNFDYDVITDDSSLDTHIAVTLNDVYVGRINKNDRSAYKQYAFVSHCHLINDIHDNTVNEIKKKIESDFEKTVLAFRNWL